MKKKSAESGPRPLWPLTCHGDDNCQSVVAGDTSFEELKLKVVCCKPIRLWRLCAAVKMLCRSVGSIAVSSEADGADLWLQSSKTLGGI